jgi:radical SAM protein with 4Fe4S-binding SPASM domain
MSSKNTSYHAARGFYAKKLFDTPESLPFRYVFILTNKCKLKCFFCFQDKKTKPGSLNTEEWLSLIDQLPEYAHVTLTGGEPLLFKGFKEIFLKITEKRTCNIISNGLLLTEEFIDLILSRPNCKVLSISVDNIGNTIRGVDPKKFAVLIEKLDLLRAKRAAMGSELIIDSKTVMLDDNAKDLAEIHAYCMETLKCDTHSFMFLKGHSIQHADYMFELDSIHSVEKAHVYKNFGTIMEQLEKVRLYNLRTGHKCFTHPKVVDLNSPISIHDYDLSYLNTEDHHKENFEGCKGPWESVHVNVDGNLFPCMAVNMGNVKEKKLPEIVNSEIFTEFKNVIREQGTINGCNRCGYLTPCKEKLSPKKGSQSPQRSVDIQL